MSRLSPWRTRSCTPTLSCAGTPNPCCRATAPIRVISTAWTLLPRFAAAPERILYQPWLVIDGRDKFVDPPATIESMYCHYVQLPAPGPALVLDRVSDRCGQPVEVTRRSARFGSPVVVPRVRGAAVVATFSFGAPIGTKLAGILLKPPTMTLTAWDRERHGPQLPVHHRYGGRRPRCLGALVARVLGRLYPSRYDEADPFRRGLGCRGRAGSRSLFTAWP